MTAPTLKPCPFCGSASLRVVGHNPDGEHWVIHAPARGCGAIGPSAATESDAAFAWNAAPRAPLPAEGEVEPC